MIRRPECVKLHLLPVPIVVIVPKACSVHQAMVSVSPGLSLSIVVITQAVRLVSVVIIVTENKAFVPEG